jgi:hypothetical protein
VSSPQYNASPSVAKPSSSPKCVNTGL